MKSALVIGHRDSCGVGIISANSNCESASTPSDRLLISTIQFNAMGFFIVSNYLKITIKSSEERYNWIMVKTKVKYD